MRAGLVYGGGVVALVALTLVIFTADMPAALGAVAQVLWVALIVALCLRGARDIRHTRLRGGPQTKDGPGNSREGLPDFDVRNAKAQGRQPEGPDEVLF